MCDTLTSPSASGLSRPVHSNQAAPHPRLQAVVARHLRHADRTPAAAYSAEALQQLLQAQAARPGAPLVLDTGCGTGDSTLRLAAAHPDALVVGVDQSAVRLARGQRKQASTSPIRSNALLLRADAADLWRLLAQARVRVHRHHLLYPNPWPKAAQLQRRWHAHPAFTALLALGGQLELRTNWLIYAQEMQQALRAAGISATVQALDAAACARQPASPFERKYALSGHGLWQLDAWLGG